MGTVSRFEADVARWAMGILPDGRLADAALRAVEDGVESTWLAALAGEPADGNAFVARDLFTRGLKELGLAKPTAHTALVIILRWWLQEIANRQDSVMDALGGLMEEVYYPAQDLGFLDKAFAGDALGIEKLVGVYWSLRDGIEEGCLTPEDQAALIKEATCEAATRAFHLGA